MQLRRISVEYYEKWFMSIGSVFHSVCFCRTFCSQKLSYFFSIWWFIKYAHFLLPTYFVLKLMNMLNSVQLDCQKKTRNLPYLTNSVLEMQREGCKLWDFLFYKGIVVQKLKLTSPNFNPLTHLTLRQFSKAHLT